MTCIALPDDTPNKLDKMTILSAVLMKTALWAYVVLAFC